ncbi:phage virion morphogenesis protein [uncultured Sphingomonas sp.]|uniref:phage virion morphogenesis protein n=1 Tax=uncultured Sphingomonas sp. TaxID=158754 RepID=UPI0025FADA83|nr:phage virion morphogenesis protein [uncultured Sphingomonas sp.]
MNDLAAVEQLASALLRSVAPPARRKILTAIARDIRRSQSDRIAAQKAPDGSAFAPRRPKPKKKGKLRQRRMFSKIRLAKHLRAQATTDEATIGFSGPASRVARVHQLGLDDAPAPGMRKVRYTRRVLLGLTPTEVACAMDFLIGNIQSAGKTL